MKLQEEKRWIRYCANSSALRLQLKSRGLAGCTREIAREESRAYKANFDFGFTLILNNLFHFPDSV